MESTNLSILGSDLSLLKVALSFGVSYDIKPKHAYVLRRAVPQKSSQIFLQKASRLAFVICK